MVVNNRKLTDHEYWYKAADRLMRDRGVKTPVGFIVHSRREVNTALRKGHYFFADIRREGIVLYEMDDEPLAEPRPLDPKALYEAEKEHFEEMFPASGEFFQLHEDATGRGWTKRAAFLLHQAVEHAYTALLLTLTNYSPPSHNLVFLRSLAEDQDRHLVDAWPRGERPYTAWFNTLNEAN